MTYIVFNSLRYLLTWILLDFIILFINLNICLVEWINFLMRVTINAQNAF